MPVLPNFNADPADLIGDDAQPALNLRNVGTGPALRAEGIVGASGASIDQLNLVGRGAGSILAGNATVGQQLIFSHPSRASGAILKFTGGLISASSILATTGGVAGTYAVRVVVPSGVFGWIPIYPDAAVTGAAVE